MVARYTYFELPLNTLTVLLTVLALDVLVPLQRGHEFCPNEVDLASTLKSASHDMRIWGILYSCGFERPARLPQVARVLECG